MVRADEGGDARALIEKAIAAQGGEAELAKRPVVTTKIKGAFHGFGNKLAFTFTGENTTQGADRVKLVIDSEAFGKFRMEYVLSGKRGWVKLNGDTRELKKEELALFLEEAYASWVTTLLPLKDKSFTLTPLGEINIDKRPVLGVKVSSKDHRDVKLFFDKETGLLIKTERLAKDEIGQEMTEEMFLSDYKAVQETKQAMKFVIKRGGKPYQSWEVIRYQFAEKPEESTFAKP
jgi:hypothetical protein